MANQFAIPQPTTQDSQTILWKKFADWLYAYCGPLAVVEPNDSQNQTMAIRASAYNACALAGLPTPTNQGQTQWIRSIAYALYSLAAGGTGLMNPNEVQGETMWIHSIACSAYSLSVGAPNLINPNNVEGESAWVRSLSFSMYALATI